MSDPTATKMAVTKPEACPLRTAGALGTNWEQAGGVRLRLWYGSQPLRSRAHLGKGSGTVGFTEQRGPWGTPPFQVKGQEASSVEPCPAPEGVGGGRGAGPERLPHSQGPSTGRREDGSRQPVSGRRGHSRP